MFVLLIIFEGGRVVIDLEGTIFFIVAFEGAILDWFPFTSFLNSGIVILNTTSFKFYCASFPEKSGKEIVVCVSLFSNFFLFYSTSEGYISLEKGRPCLISSLK